MSIDNKKYKVAFLHPDLGIGGAERLVVDAALALQAAGDDITIYTSHCDLNHCFEEIQNAQLFVKVYGDFLPTSLKGKFKIVFAFLRQLYLSLKLIITLQIFQYDIIVLDQLSYCIPLLSLFCWNSRILFYCHFPDKLLAPRTGLLRQIYRFLFDLIEEVSTSYADKIVVNSEFTRSMVYKTFKSLRNKHLDVLYPCVSTDTSSFDPTLDAIEETDRIVNSKSFFLSINRFERKKNIGLAIKAFASYISETGDNQQMLVIAGGYDTANLENKTCYEELVKLCTSLKLASCEYKEGTIPENSVKVVFLKSIDTNLKNALLKKCDLLLYTPTNEHFGIVPIEAIRMGKLVLADSTGGPLETIVNYFEDKNNYTGFTVTADVVKWKDVLELVKGLSDSELKKVSERAIARVNKKFSFDAMKANLVRILDDMQKLPTGLFGNHIIALVISMGIMYQLFNKFEV
ncbi:hypothetical protein CANINC_004818 [Pichia inconspicua]|uniref:Alpha-1,3/1,6-mannosyltransferase ALG2 n=1 Tax=Pichia inconspicua TaxID=52247 RepID=A0A4T0WWK0_9ASCO|nr:hypothetical protein CANINC_004818 [[Candida] inconspicua]